MEMRAWRLSLVGTVMVLLLAGTASTLAQSPSPEPPPWLGGRVEMPEHGFAVAVPDPSDEAAAQGWATAMSGEFTARLRRNGRAERARASISDVQVICFVEPERSGSADEMSA